MNSVAGMILLSMMLLHQASQPEMEAIRALLARQQNDWNRGDIVAFMSGYARKPGLVFTSGGRVFRGWDQALARYQAGYPDREAMGKLTFSDLEITILGQSAAVVLGKWSLERARDTPHGVFTLVLERESGRWLIIHDHTSAER
jgi:ketosteroid isomerase-like protein